MARPIREVLIAAVHAQLGSETTATVFRSRRASVDATQETLPILVVHLTSMEADDTLEPQFVHYRCTIEVAGTADGDTDELADAALSDLHAATVAALDGWSPNSATFLEFSVLTSEFRMHDADESAAPIGEFVATFAITAVAQSGSVLAQE